MPIKECQNCSKLKTTLLQTYNQLDQERQALEVSRSQVSAQKTYLANADYAKKKLEDILKVRNKQIKELEAEKRNSESGWEKGWFEKYKELERKTDERWKQDTETIQRLKEKLKKWREIEKINGLWRRKHA